MAYRESLVLIIAEISMFTETDKWTYTIDRQADRQAEGYGIATPSFSCYIHLHKVSKPFLMVKVINTLYLFTKNPTSLYS